MEIINFIELMLMATLLLFITMKGFQRYILSSSLMILIILTLLSMFLAREGFNKILNGATMIQVMLIMTIVAIIFLLSRKRKKDRRLIYCFLWFLTGSLLLSKGIDGRVGFLGIMIKLISYYGFYHYFYKGAYIALEKQMKEVEKLKTSLKQTYDEEVKKQLFYMELQQERLISAAHMDAMTETYNKKAILDILEELLSLKKEPISIMMIDIDCFKKINDFHGHVVGDQCIKELVAIIQRNIRKLDYIGRYGGDEFIVILPDASAIIAKNIAEDIRESISRESNPRVTISVGIACYPQDGQTPLDLIAKADKGLYTSKRKGKNNVSHTTMF
ncbi:GGDEF domain-containing protein [Natronincola peptidivorans]|nr:GGDEF domain-containing protein [Natronincola peptidivorans]